MGRSEVRAVLLRYLREEPTAELIDAITPLADEECIVLLARIARAMPYLSEAALDALLSIDHPHAGKVAAALGENRSGEILPNGGFRSGVGSCTGAGVSTRRRVFATTIGKP
jgi:hypothetical protein